MLHQSYWFCKQMSCEDTLETKVLWKLGTFYSCFKLSKDFFLLVLQNKTEFQPDFLLQSHIPDSVTVLLNTKVDGQAVT